MKLLDCYGSLIKTTARSMILFDPCLCGVKDMLASNGLQDGALSCQGEEWKDLARTPFFVLLAGTMGDVLIGAITGT
jgi:hypothetical protein